MDQCARLSVLVPRTWIDRFHLFKSYGDLYCVEAAAAASVAQGDGNEDGSDQDDDDDDDDEDYRQNP